MHKQSKKANEEGTFKDKVRVIAFVSFISSMIFLFFILILSYIKTNINDYSVISFVPELSEFRHFPSIFFGIFVGIFMAPLNRYLKWSATYKIKTENVLSIMAFMSVFTFIAEKSLISLPAFAINKQIIEGDRGLILMLLVIVSTVGAGLPVFIKAYKSRKDNRKLNFKKAAMFGLDARIALAIFGALSIITGASLYSVLNKTKAKTVLTDLENIGKAFEQYFIDVRKLPTLNVFHYSMTELIESSESN